MLSHALAHQVTNRIRAKGARCFESGAVERVSLQGQFLSATVVGTERYAVWVEGNGRQMHAACTCPFFLERFVICKHIWAALLAADAQGLRLIPRGVSPSSVTLSPMDADALDDIPDDEDGLDDEIDDSCNDEVETLPAYVIRMPQISRGGSPDSRSRSPRTATKRSPPRWRQALEQLRAPAVAATPAALHLPGELAFAIDIAQSLAYGAVVVDLVIRERKRDGTFRLPKPARFGMADAQRLPEAERGVVERLIGARSDPTYYYGTYADTWRFYLRGRLTEVLREICQTSCCLARVVPSPPAPPASRQQRYRTPPPRVAPVFHPLAWDDGPAWRFELEVTGDADRHVYTVSGGLRREGERLAPADPLLLLADGLIVTSTHVGRAAMRGGFNWLALLRRDGPLEVPIGEGQALIEALLPVSDAIAAMPEELRATVTDGHPTPWLHVSPERYGGRCVVAELHFDYAGHQVPAASPQPTIRSGDPRRFIRRDVEAERACHDALGRVGFEIEWRADRSAQAPHLPAHRLPDAIRALTAEGWQVIADGLRYRQPGTVALSVTSGIDWFELEGHVDYDGQHLTLPELLAALRSGDLYVPLGDGSVGLLPEEWLRTQGLLASLGSAHGGALRFKRSQVMVLDALLAAQPAATCDETFARARSELQRFNGIVPADPPAAFRGALREYQREGLGWLRFLRQFGFGGCLADDMGLGKTVMVLALLARHRAESPDGAPPSLVIAPRSLVFNWQQEAARFTPGLRLLDYTGLERAASRARFPEVDLVLTTYGTLRRDAALLSETEFDYVVLDESQAIKNASSASAKAARLLRARHRLALSGTPIENHLGELWSLFEFLNPGVLGSSTAFERTSGPGRPDGAALAALTRGLRPFILRRTKDQVAPELPAKTEQTISCELEGPQRKLYNELRDHYRRSLLANTNGAGLGRAKLQVLEALLRLRQAACHPALIDPKRRGDDSAKLDVLIPHVTQAVEEGHKTLVFSQFTSLLSILRQRLDAARIEYEYLDGRTRDREPRVTRFQTDPACRLFLISLKAGGVGLNLTAAEYVFLLDPWWNPAVEAQAIDRAHRIGQTRHVFAYRLIARDTVEERVLELQQRKRSLADAILAADGGLIKDLRREDLDLLLS